MIDVFNVDKSRLLEEVLDRYDARFDASRTGWQKIRCINGPGHAEGDRNPSATINLAFGRYHCFACDLAGDGFDLLRELEDVKPRDVLEALKMEPGKEESEFLF